MLAISGLDDFVFGKAPYPVSAGRGLVIGGGEVVPELNFTLPPIDIIDANWPEVRDQYVEMIGAVCERAVSIGTPSLLVEFETLPPMTIRPAWGLEIAKILSEALHKTNDKYGIKTALRLTPNDSRDHIGRPPIMRSGIYLEGMVEFFRKAGTVGADFLSIESTGGKEICDTALMNGDLRTLLFALGVLAPRDMRFLWGEIVAACNENGVVPAGDSACGYANTAMVLAEQKLLPRVFAAVVRVASVPRSLVAYEMGAVGPSKDCAYEGPYMKAIAGVPISMEGRSAACAHLSPVGNISQAVCDCWSNESVQNVRLLSASAPVVSLEQLVYDCRLMRAAANSGGAGTLRDWLADSDASLDPQAHVLRPDVVLKLSAEIVAEKTPYLRTRRAVLATVQELRRAKSAGEVSIETREAAWLDKLERTVNELPEAEDEFVAEMKVELKDEPWLPSEYGLS
ncbi:MAG: methyltransferase MtaB domain-containing protein [Capsulimonadaceae bacterium]|nr:methyltransferase MtaB domain-containing protein [Capsulimonadaceae bacterium]